MVWALVVGRRRAAKPGQEPQLSWLACLLGTGLPYVFSAVMAGWVGLMLAGRLRVGLATVGAGLEVDELLVVLLGGTALGSLPIGNSVVNIFGGLGAAQAFAIVQNLQALSGGQAAVLEIGKSVALVLTGLVSYLYYLIVARLRTSSRGPATPKPK